MRFTVTVSPGSNCDADMLWAIREIMGANTEFVRYGESSLRGFDGVLLPGESSYGDYLGCGAIARFFTIMEGVTRFAKEGRPVFGTCNGFQILAEAGPLPGVLRRNKSLHFIYKTVPLKVNPKTAFTSKYEADEIIYLPVTHEKGNYFCDEETPQELKKNNQTVFTHNDNINDSVENIAGITNGVGNMLGMMPHPERAVEDLLGSENGRRFFASVLKSFGEVTV